MLAQNAMLDIKSKFYLVNIYLLPKLIGWSNIYLISLLSKKNLFILNQVVLNLINIY